MSIKFTNNPLPPNQFTNGAALGSQYSIVFEIILIMIDINMIVMILTRFSTGFYDAAMMKGGTKLTYWTSQYIIDVLVLMVFLPPLALSGYIFGL